MTIVTARLTNNLVYKVTIITYSNSKYISCVVTRDKVSLVSFETFKLVLSDVTYFIVSATSFLLLHVFRRRQAIDFISVARTHGPETKLTHRSNKMMTHVAT